MGLTASPLHSFLFSRIFLLLDVAYEQCMYHAMHAVLCKLVRASEIL